MSQNAKLLLSLVAEFQKKDEVLERLSPQFKDSDPFRSLGITIKYRAAQIIAGNYAY